MTQFINTQRGSKWEKGDKGDQGKSWASLKSVAWDWNDMAFTDTDDHTVKLVDAKIDLKWDQGNPWTPWAAATISVGTTTTWNPWTNASVTNSGTSSAAVFNFTIPRWADWQDWQDWAAATISAWTASTLPAGSTPTVTNSGTSSAAVFNFGIPKWDTWATWNWIASVTSSKSWKVTTVTITETDWDSSSFTVTDWADWEWSGDVLWPSSAVSGHLAVFDWTTWKLIKDGWAIPTPTTVVDNLTTQSATSALSANQGYVLDWKISTINWKIPSEATSSNKLADKNYVDDSINSVTAYYITKNAAWDQFATYAELSSASTFYSGWVVRTPTRNDYCIVVADENHDNATTRYIYQGSQWEYQYTVNETALTTAQLNALNSWITSTKVWQYDSAVSTISWYWDIVTHDASEFATATQWWKADSALQPNDNITELNNNAGYITSSSLPWKASSSTLGTVKLGSDTVQSVSANAVTGTASRTYATQLNSSDQLVVNVPRTDTTYESKTAASWGTDVSLVTTWEKYTWNNKQNALTTQTAYTTKWTATKVPTITTNTLWQVTAITETNITFPVTSVNGSTGAVSVSEFNPWGTATTGYVLKKTADWYWWDAESWAVTSVNWQTWAVTVSEFTPSGTATTWYVVTKTAWGYEWAAPSGWIWISTDANNILTSWASIWVGTEANYAAITTKSDNTIYLTI